MLDDPETSAVNNYLQMWGAENLFIVGAAKQDKVKKSV